MPDTDEKIQAIEKKNDRRLSDMHREHIDAMNKLSDMCMETKDEVVQTRLEVAKLDGSLKVLDSKIGGLARSEDLTKQIVKVR